MTGRSKPKLVIKPAPPPTVINAKLVIKPAPPPTVINAKLVIQKAPPRVIADPALQSFVEQMKEVGALPEQRSKRKPRR